MGRNKGGENCSKYKWRFVIKNPICLKEEIWSKKYTTIEKMAEDLHESFTIKQLQSYASNTRNPPSIIELEKIDERIELIDYMKDNDNVGDWVISFLREE